MNKIKVLHVVTVMDIGGIETTIMNYFRSLDKDKFSFDFLVHRENPGFFDEEIRKLGGSIYYAPSLSSFSGMASYRKWSVNFFRENRFDIVHSHLDALSYFPLYGAKVNGVPVRIAHSHVNGFTRDLKYPLRLVLKKLIPTVATSFFASSKEAAEFMFGSRQYKIIVNPVNVKEFSFDADKRNLLRNQYGIDQNMRVIGHVGRFSEPKNHKFIIEIMRHLEKERYILVLLGDGELFNEIQELSHDLNVPNIIFLGAKSNPSEYYSMFDVFILPSLYEGLGIVALEAQINGLPVIISDRVSNDVILSENITQLPLSLDSWVQNIESTVFNRTSHISTALQAYDVKVSTKNLQDIYLSLVGRGELWFHILLLSS